MKSSHLIFFFDAHHIVNAALLNYLCLIMHHSTVPFQQEIHHFNETRCSHGAHKYWFIYLLELWTSSVTTVAGPQLHVLITQPEWKTNENRKAAVSQPFRGIKNLKMKDNKTPYQWCMSYYLHISISNSLTDEPFLSSQHSSCAWRISGPSWRRAARCSAWRKASCLRPLTFSTSETLER